LRYYHSGFYILAAKKGHGLNDIVAGAFQWALRFVVFAAGALLFIGLLALGALLALLWLARTLWARLTGRPSTPWTMHVMNPREGWSTVYRSTARWTAPNSRADVTDVIAREVH